MEAETVKIEPLETRKIPCSAARPGNGLKIRRLRPVYILCKLLFMNDLQNNLARAKTAVFGDMSAFSAHPSDFPSAARPQPKGIRRCTLIIADETSVHCIHWRDFRASQRASNKRNRCGVENSNANPFVCGLSVPHQALLAGLPRISGAPFIHNHHLTLNHSQSPAL
jgi:hypothetical protein